MSDNRPAEETSILTSEYWLARRKHLYLASCVALIVTAMSFAIRGDITTQLVSQFHLDKAQMGWIDGAAFWGFTLAIVFGGPLCDDLGMGTILALAALGHAAGILITIFATSFWMLFAGTLAIGLANGCVEAACNPLLAGLYPDEKIKRLSRFHMWFPGGIVIGGLAAAAISGLHWNPGIAWQIKMATMILPLVIYAAMLVGRKFPPTERAAAGVSAKHMFHESKRLAFILFVLMMLMTAATELVIGQWIPNILTFTTAVTGILYLVWINGLMAVGRYWAGHLVARVSPIGLLLICSCVGVVGVFLLSQAHSAAVAALAATLFAIGVCYYWPTMLGVINERFPKTGAWGLAVMGGAGNLSVSLFLPLFGKFYDRGTAAAIGAGATVSQVQAAGGPAWIRAQALGGAYAIEWMTILPAVLVVLFLAIYLWDRTQGGYKKQVI